MDILHGAKKIIKNSLRYIESERRGTEKKQDQNLKRVEELYAGFDREHIWAFNAGQVSQDFRGNPKYLFVYINRYRPDIRAYWFCDKEETLEQVRTLGFEAYKIGTAEAQYVMNRTGVVVAEQVKWAMPEAFGNVKYINLWHGVGFKSVERRLFDGQIAMDLARKYVMRGTFYRDHQLMNATCPIIEEEYTNDCGVDADKFLRVGYPRCLYQSNYEPVVSFDHDLRKIKGLSPDAKMVVYAPTYRATLGGTFSKALPDFERLYKLCEENNLLFIFKVHPHMEKEVGFLRAWETYGDRPHFLFWDNRNDFYEIMHQMDLCIVDYSSVISDMVAAGVKHYIRYVFDFEEYQNTVSLHDNYFEKTTGKLCYTFDELLDAVDTFEERDEAAEIAELNEKLWSYSQGKADFDRIIDQALQFQIEERQFPTLYSFDIFDTLFSRKVLDPAGIFYAVREKIIEDGSFPVSLREKYPSIRHTAEMNVREYYNKSKVIRNSNKTEISFDEIFERIANVYNLSEQQVGLLKKWELEVEYDNVIPLPEQIDLVKQLLADNQQVVLISDMYLPKDVILRMLEKADPVLATLPLFLSSEYGVLKTSQLLFFEVYKSFEPYYDFKKWIHYGDNPKADQEQPRNFQINTRKINRIEFNQYQKQLIEFMGTYDGYLTAAMQARLCHENYKSDELVISFIALCFVPYIDWVLRDAERRGYQTLYFIARDGHHLKRIADTIIKERGLNIKTKFIYASRRTWRIPSFVHEVDMDFWEPHGSFGDILSKDKLLNAMRLTEEKFRELFPYINLDSINFLDTKEFNSIKDIFKNSKAYNDYLLEIAAEQRELVCGYLKQEIDPNEKHAFVEYYGRGYTQDCYVRLWRDITGDDNAQVPYYYYRSIMPDMNGAIRHNFTTNDTKPYFIEAIFANMPYKSIQEYKLEDGLIKPVIVPLDCNREMFDAMNSILPEFARRYAHLGLNNPEDTDHMLMEFVFHFYCTNLSNRSFADQIGALIDSVTLYGNKRELAPAFTEDILNHFQKKTLTRESMKVTSSSLMSATRTTGKERTRYCEMYQILPEDSLSSGKLLSKEQQRKNKTFENQFKQLENTGEAFANRYCDFVAEKSVEEKIVLVTERDSLRNTSLQPVKELLEHQTKYQVQEFCLASNPRDSELAEALASAAFILINNPIPLFCKVVFRKETQLILLPQNAFTLYNRGPACNHYLKWMRKFRRLSQTNELSCIQLASKNREAFFRKIYCEKRSASCNLLGNSATDLYFDAAWVKNSKEMLTRQFPGAAGKKVILYMPKWRVRSECKDWLRILDLEILQQMLGPEYVVALHFKETEIEHAVKNKLDIPGFSKDLSKLMDIRMLMAASDIIVGDYRDEFFEAPLLRKPTFSTADDYETVTRVDNMSLNGNQFDKFLFCPLVCSAEQLGKRIHDIQFYDYGPMDSFCREMLTFCDGYSSERVVQYLMKPSTEEAYCIHPDADR